MTDYARGERLQELRAAKRMSREDVAHEVGVTTKTLYEWEKHDGAIKWENTKKIAAFYKVDPENLVTREASGQLAAQADLREQLDRIEQKVDDLLAQVNGGVSPLEELEQDEEETLRRRRRQPSGGKSAATEPGSPR